MGAKVVAPVLKHETAQAYCGGKSPRISNLGIILRSAVRFEGCPIFSEYDRVTRLNDSQNLSEPDYEGRTGVLSRD